MAEHVNELLLPGKVFTTSLDINPVRVIMSDGIMVFYEIWWSFCKDWGYRSNLKKKAIYYRTTVDNFLSDASYFRTDELSSEELAIHRPDLPLYLCRNMELGWTRKKYSTVEAFEKENQEVLKFTLLQGDLNIDRVILVPYGPSGGPKKGIVIEARNGKSFNWIELLWNAQNIQSDYQRPETESGVGIYRSGFEKKMPSFYIGGYVDSAGFLT